MSNLFLNIKNINPEISFLEFLKLIPIPILVLDQKDEIIDANIQAGALFVSERSKLYGKTLCEAAGCVLKRNVEFECKNSRSCVFCGFHPSQANTDTNNTSVLEGAAIFNAHSQPVWKDLLIYCSRVGASDKIFNIVTIIDVTLQRDFERVALLSKQRLALIGMHSARIVHDLKSPLTVINGYADLLGDRVTDAPNNALIRKIMDASKRINFMVEEITDLASGKPGMALQFQSFLLKPFFEDICTGLQCQDWCCIDIPETIFICADKNKMELVFWNITKNAKEVLTSHSSPCITFSAIEKNTYIEITVKDNGPGIPQELLGKLFSPAATHGKKEGHGFGLFGAYQIVLHHKGEMEVDSVPNQGVAFIIRLPKINQTDPANNISSLKL